MKKSLFVIAVSLFLFAGLSHAQKYGEGRIIAHGTNPQFINDTLIAYLSSGHLTTVDVNGKNHEQISQRSISGFLPLRDGKFVLWHHGKVGMESTRSIWMIDSTRRETEVVSNVITGRNSRTISVPVKLPDGTVGYYTQGAGTMSFTIIQKGLSEEPLKQWLMDIKPNSPNVAYGELWLTTVDRNESQLVSSDCHYLPRIFPDGSQQCDNCLLAADCGGKLKLFMVDTSVHSWIIGDPNEKTDDTTVGGVEYKIVRFATLASTARWSDNCEWIVTLYQAAVLQYGWDDYDIISSDIQILSVDTTVNIKIHTPDIMESNPSISSDGAVVCETEKGEIVIYRRKE